VSHCCNARNIETVNEAIEVGEFLFPYVLTYCTNCGSVLARTHIKDGKTMFVKYDKGDDK